MYNMYRTPSFSLQWQRWRTFRRNNVTGFLYSKSSPFPGVEPFLWNIQPTFFTFSVPTSEQRVVLIHHRMTDPGSTCLCRPFAAPIGKCCHKHHCRGTWLTAFALNEKNVCLIFHRKRAMSWNFSNSEPTFPTATYPWRHSAPSLQLFFTLSFSWI